MNQSSLDQDEDQDSLFGSPPPSPARGRSPSPETLIAGREAGPTNIPSAGTGRKNVGTIALPGSHMSCAELPADLSAPSFHPTSSHDSSSVTLSDVTGTPSLLHSSVAASRSSTHSVPSRASSTRSIGSSVSASTKKRKKSKARSTSQISSPPVTLPGPNEPTPPNFLRSQSSLLGLAGVVGCVKPAQLRTHDPKPAPVPRPSSPTPICGSIPTHPIVVDDDQDVYATHTGKRPVDQLQMPQRLDQLDSELFYSNITSSLTKEKNIFPVLESLIKLFGVEPQFPRTDPPPQLFARPYGHGIFSTQSSSILPSLPVPGGLTTPTIPPPKRRKLKHVPAGAVDWDVPFPFAAGEGPEAYRNTWARDRAKQLLTQLLELVQNAAKRAAIKTAKTRVKVHKGRTPARSSQSSRSASVETQTGQGNLIQPNVRESPSYTSPNVETGTSVESLSHYLGLLETPGTSGSARGSQDRMTMDLECAAEEGSSAVPCDYSAFEEWLSQLQQFLPPETNAATPESDWDTRPPVSLDTVTTDPGPDILYPMHPATRDEVIDPALLAISQQFGVAPQSHSSTSTTTIGVVPQLFDIPQIPPALAHSPRTSLSSLTEPLTPHSEAFADVPTSMVANQGLVHNPYIHQSVEKEYPPSGNRVQPYSPTESPEHPPITATQKVKARTDGSVASTASSTSIRSTPSATSTSKVVLDKQAILERAQERRRQLVAEIERAKVEIWETTIENAVLVHFTRDGSL